MKQSKLESLVEAILNTLSGFFLSWFAWVLVVAPYLGLPFSWSKSLTITLFFTVLSISRNYFVRRFFANDFHKAAVEIANKFKEKK